VRDTLTDEDDQMRQSGLQTAQHIATRNANNSCSLSYNLYYKR